MNNKPDRNIFRLSWRILFGTLLVVELLALFQVLQLSPTYTTLGLIITVSFTWIVAEIIQVVFQIFGVHNLYRWHMTLSLALIVYLDAIGDFFHFYETIPNYDGFLHFFTPAIGTWWIWQLLITIYSTLPHRFLLLCTTAITIAISAVYEVEEYLEDTLTGSHRLGDSFDTGNDLFMDTVGVVLVVTIIAVYLRRKKIIKTTQYFNR